MFTLAEAAVSVGSHAMQAFMSVWSAMKALKILKCVSILADVCDITTSVISITTMLNSWMKTGEKDLLQLAGEIGKIAYAVIDIYFIVAGIGIKNDKIKKIDNYFKYGFEGIGGIIEDFKNGNIGKALIDILLLIKDVLLDYAGREKSKISGDQNAFLELLSDERKFPKIDSDVKNILYGWAKEYKVVLDYFGQLFYLW